MTSHDPSPIGTGIAARRQGSAGRVLLLWVFPLIGLVFGGLLVGVFAHQARQDHAVGYMVSAPGNCVLELAARPGGAPEHTVEQYRFYRRVVCDPPPRGAEVFYDPATGEEVPGPDNDRYGMVFGAAVAFVFAAPGILGWTVVLRERRRRRARTSRPLP